MKIGGKDRAVKFGINQSVIYCELRNCSITQMNKDIADLGAGSGDVGVMRDFIYSALKEGARKAGEPFDFTNYDVGDWLENFDESEMESFFKELVDSMPKAKEGKKKAVTS
jgi:hypothetical protein